MRLLLQMLGAFFLFSWVMTVGSCMLIGSAVSHAAADAGRAHEQADSRDFSPVRSDMAPADAMATGGGPTREIVPGQPMLDPTPPGERKHRWDD